METMALLEEATNILKVEPHMRETLESKIKTLSTQLDDEFRPEGNNNTEVEFLDVD